MINAILLTAFVVSFGANLVLAQRLDDLRRTGRAPTAPPLARYLLWSGQWWPGSGAYHQINDRMTTMLVWIIRTALVVLLLAGVVNLLRR